MTQLTIVAHIHAAPEQTAHVKSELKKLIPLTLPEKGCLQYDLHQDNDKPNHFMFFENWESRELWQEHMNAPHLAAFMSATEGAITEFVLHEMTRSD